MITKDIKLMSMFPRTTIGMKPGQASSTYFIILYTPIY